MAKQVFDSKTLIESVGSVFSEKPSYTHQALVELSKDAYRTITKVRVPNKENVVHIAGNQEDLTDWNSVLKLEKAYDFEREITLDLNFTAVFKFTRGIWGPEAIVKGNVTLVDYEYYKPLQIDLDWDGQVFEIGSWKDRISN